MATKKTTHTTVGATAPAPAPVAPPEPQPYAQPEYAQQYAPVAYPAAPKRKAQWLTFEYALAMGSLVLAVLLITSALVAVFGGWAGQGSAVAHSGTSWALGLFSIYMTTPATGLVVTGVAATLLSVVALLCFGRVSRTIPEREGYTGRIAYKTITYGAFAALALSALALTAKLVGILISALLFIGVSGAGEVYKSLFLAEFLPYALGLGLIVGVMVFIGHIIKGANKSRIVSFIVMGVAVAVLVASAITVAVQVRDTGSSRYQSDSYMRGLPSLDLF